MTKFQLVKKEGLANKFRIWGRAEVEGTTSEEIMLPVDKKTFNWVDFGIEYEIDLQAGKFINRKD